MMQITEDTPPDMLAGAMDLTVHLPNGKAVKTSVERSTPMMDLLVQITTANHLQLSNHTLQVLGMAPSSVYSDKVLPYKPNTPIGTLDTQHIRVLPKGKSLSQSKLSSAPGHQPFESTFRLKVHLPRNQLYVTRVSRNVLLEDIMKKVCEEKNLDPLKYDFKRPGNLDEVLDPKLTLSDYQITEIYVVSKGITSLNQAFSPADIMVLRREEERKQMHNKSGGGVFNLIFKRGKPSMGSGSVSSNENRSISPTHSDDSRSVTPPAMPPPKKEPPKPPQRKRRPAPKPPQVTPQISVSENEVELRHNTGSSSVVSTNEEEEEDTNQAESNGLTICHSRNSSDSSGYHEASILSEHAASLGRNRPKSAFVGDPPSNLAEMAGQSRSTTSLIAGRKKKAAPPPPAAAAPVAAVSPANSVIAPSSPLLVASQPPEIRPTTEFPEVSENATESASTTNHVGAVPVPKPRKRPPKTVPRKRPRSFDDSRSEREQLEAELGIEPLSFELADIADVPEKEETEPAVVETNILNTHEAFAKVDADVTPAHQETPHLERKTPNSDEYSMEEILSSLEAVKPFIMRSHETLYSLPTTPQPIMKISSLQRTAVLDIFNSEEFLKEPKPPEVVGVIRKSPVKDAQPTLSEDDDFEEASSADAALGHETGTRNNWVMAPEASKISETTLSLSPLSENTTAPLQSSTPKTHQQEKSLESTDSGIAQDRDKEPDEDSGFRTPPPPPVLDDAPFIIHPTSETEVDAGVIPQPAVIEEAPIQTETPPTKPLQDMEDWQYQLPSPPKAFRDSSPQIEQVSHYSVSESEFKDSVVTSPELFEKLRTLEDKESASSEEPPLNTLSLEHLEKRKSLVYNRELATSLKMSDTAEAKPKYTQHHHTLPNFKITTYDVPKHQNIKVFEDDTVRSNENVTYRNKSKRPSLETGTALPGAGVSRSGSFSTESSWSPAKPVSRSKSTLTLNKYQPPKETVATGNDVMSRSSSLFDVSGLHSLEVMKQIRTKLHSPEGSSESLKTIPQKPEPPSPPDLSPAEPKPPSPQAVKKYYYRGPPAVNMTTWSERPKVPVAVKEDEDYKLGNVNQKTEITQNSGNVVIKIGATAPPSNIVNSSSKLLAPAGYRRPLSNINGGAPHQRPHSFLEFDSNRAPVVRGVEFKKPFKNFHNNTSVVHLNSPDEVTLRGNRQNGTSGGVAVNNRASWAGGFSTLPAKPKTEPHTYEPNQKVPFSQSTLRRTESSKLYAADLNSNVYVEKNNNYYDSFGKVRQHPQMAANAPPPPPPQLPKVTLKKVVQREKSQSDGSGDARGELMESIRSFGGKKGLKAVKA